VSQPSPGRFDVLVLGGGPAGVSAAIYSARKGLRTGLVAERVGGQVRDIVSIETLLGTPGTDGPRLAAQFEAHLRSYPIEVLELRRVVGIEDGPWKAVLLAGGERLEARQLVVATGAQWQRLGVPGEQEHLGRGVGYCPHCDGPFYKDRPVAVVGGGEKAVKSALDLAATSSQVTLVEAGEQLGADPPLQARLAQQPRIHVLTRARVTRILGDGAQAQGLEYQEGDGGPLKTLAVDGIFLQVGLVPNSAAFQGALVLNAAGELVIDHRNRSSVSGIYGAGDVTNVPFKQVSVAVGEGAKAALAAFEDRVREGWAGA
jgi:alkyl hydroperoxide reductase subunit F